MAYKSKTELENDRWMLDTVAVEQIMAFDHCDEATAIKQLRAFKGDNPAIVRRIDPPANLGPVTLRPQLVDPPEVDRFSINRQWPMKPIPDRRHMPDQKPLAGAGDEKADRDRGGPYGDASVRPPDTRKTNGIDYREADAPLVAEMRDMIVAGKAQSPEGAARYVVARAVGGGQESSKVKRLAKHYRKTTFTPS